MLRQLFLARLHDQPVAWQYPNSIFKALYRVHNFGKWIDRRMQKNRGSLYDELWWEYQGAISDYKALKKFKATRSTLQKVLNRGMPVSYAIGHVHLADLRLAVRPGVLIPRPDTESWLVELLKHITDIKSLLDAGTGSGVIALKLAKALGDKVQVTGVDCSPLAIRLAQHNAKLNKLDNVKFILSDMSTIDCKADLLISNPPYIPRAKRACQVSPATRRWEPASALHPPLRDDGTYYHKLLIDLAKISGCKHIAMELDGTRKQYKTVAKYLVDAGFGHVKPLSDGNKPFRAIFAHK